MYLIDLKHMSQIFRIIIRVATCPRCPGIILEFFLSLIMSWDWKISLIVLEIRTFTFFMSWKILNVTSSKRFDH